MKSQSTLTATKVSANPQAPQQAKKGPSAESAEFAGALAVAGAPQAQQPLVQTNSTTQSATISPQAQAQAQAQASAPVQGQTLPQAQAALPQGEAPNAKAASDQATAAKASQQAKQASAQKAPAQNAVSTSAINAEKSMLTQNPAASTNTAAANTGLQPWSKEWVFGGALEEQTPNAQSQDAQTAQMAAQSLSAQAMLQAQAAKAQPQAPVSPQQGEQAQAGQAKAQNGAAQKTAQKADVLSRNPQDALAQAQLGAPIVGMQALNAQESMRPVRGEAKGAQNNAKGKPVAQAAGTAAGAAVAGDLTLSQLESQLEALSGGIEDVNATQSLERPVAQAVPKNSSLSGSEFLDTLKSVRGGNPEFANSVKRDLKVIDGGKPSMGQAQAEAAFGESAQLTAKPRLLRAAGVGEESQALTAASGVPFKEQLATAAPATIVTGHVTSGAMSQDRLSSESLKNVGLGIKNLGANGGGEIRIRLKPENLGELHVRVVTSGKDVGLQIQASDESARKVLEESLNSLKDSLAHQNLTLGKVEFLVAGAAASSSSSAFDQQSSQQQQQPQNQAFNSMMNQDAGQGNQRGQWGNEGQQNFGPRVAASGAQSGSSMGGAQASRRAAGGSSRLDVMA